MNCLREFLCDFGIHRWRWHKCSIHNYDWCTHCMIFRLHRPHTPSGNREYMEYTDSKLDPRD